MFWELSGAQSDDFVVFDDTSGTSVSYRKLKEDISDCKKQLLAERKKLAFIFTNNSYSSILSYLSVLNSGHALCLLDDKMELALYEKLIKRYTPEIIWKSNSDNLKFEDYCFKNISNNLGYYFRNKGISKHKIHEDTAVLLSTSGTTGSPKFVRLSYNNIQSNAQSISMYLQLSSKEKAITTLPMHYSYGLSVINSHLNSCGSLVFTEKTIIERAFWDLFNLQKCTSFAGVPYTFEMLKRIKFENMQLPSLSSITQAGGSLDQKLTQHFYKISQKKNFSFHVMYGQTEASPRISHVPYSMLSKKMGSIGIPVPGGKLRITKDGKPENEAGKQGEIVYEGPNVMLGYGEKRIDLNNGDNLNGVLYTGDTGYFDEDGYFFLVGRLKRMIKIFGQRVNLDEIENMLEIYSGKDVACFGEEDKLYVILESDDESDNLNIINKLTSLYHIHHSAIKSFCVDSLVYKSSGKKDYQALKMKINNETN